jgi:hypothetical protein
MVLLCIDVQWAKRTASVAFPRIWTEDLVSIFFKKQEKSKSDITFQLPCTEIEKQEINIAVYSILLAHLEFKKKRIKHHLH